MHLEKDLRGLYKVCLRHFKKEIEERNNFNPLVNTGQKNPYLVDQHLLEKDNA